MANIDQLNNHHTAANTKISAVILDLDRTLLHTEFVLKCVLNDYFASYGKVLIVDNVQGRVGRTQKDTAAAIINKYDLPLTPDQYLAEINPLYHARLKESTALPGANRLIYHLHKHHIPFALASNGSRQFIEAKISDQKGWKECFSAIVGSDQVQVGKPSPDLFLEAAKRLSADTSTCLVIEDSVVGVKAGKAAGMKVLVVPSKTEADAAALADSSLHSLLEFQPEPWGLPPFDDWVDNALPVDPVYMEGQLADGLFSEFSEGLANVLPRQVCGIFFGWAKIDSSEDIKVLVRIGIQPFYSSQSNIKLCSLDESIDQVSVEHMHVVLVGYIRGFSSKGTLPVNMEIHENDKSVALASLKLPMFRCPKFS